jgi:hypothetical protein
LTLFKISGTFIFEQSRIKVRYGGSSSDLYI